MLRDTCSTSTRESTVHTVQLDTVNKRNNVLRLLARPAVAGMFVYRWRIRREMQASGHAAAGAGHDVQSAEEQYNACRRFEALHDRARLPPSMQAEVHAIMREYLPLGSTDADTAALSESLLSRSPGRTGSSGGGGGSPGGRRKPGVAAEGGVDVERGGVAAVLLPATPARWVRCASPCPRAPKDCTAAGVAQPVYCAISASNGRPAIHTRQLLCSALQPAPAPQAG